MSQIRLNFESRHLISLSFFIFFSFCLHNLARFIMLLLTYQANIVGGWIYLPHIRTMPSPNSFRSGKGPCANRICQSMKLKSAENVLLTD